jgi:hypothetical protein
MLDRASSVPTMTQQWLTVLGIALDFVGFMLLLREWWLAFFNEARQLAMEEQLERMRAVRTIRPRAPGEPNPWESLERVQDEQAIRKARTLHRAAMAARRGTFLVSMILIVLGFLLQIVGAWPGCCPPWIAPQP